MPDEPKNQNQPAKRFAKFNGFKQEFTGFLWEFSVMGLAIGVVIGGAVNAFVSTLVQGILTPLIQLVIPSETLKSLTYQYNGVTFSFGPFLNAFINLLLVALIVFLAVKFLIFRGGKIERAKLGRD